MATEAEIRAKSILEGKRFYTLGSPLPTRWSQWFWAELAREGRFRGSRLCEQSGKNERRDHGAAPSFADVLEPSEWSSRLLVEH